MGGNGDGDGRGERVDVISPHQQSWLPNLKGFTIYKGTRDFGTTIQLARTHSFSPPGTCYISGKITVNGRGTKIKKDVVISSNGEEFLLRIGKRMH